MPGNVIQVDTRDTRRKVSRHAAIPKTLAGGHHLVVLVHGHKNDPWSASKNYRNYSKYFSKDKRYTVIELFWMSDYWGILYHKSLEQLLRASKAIGEEINNDINSNLQQKFTFLGHSLGCRFILESIKHLALKIQNSGSLSLEDSIEAIRGDTIQRIIFMAPAISPDLLSSSTEYELERYAPFRRLYYSDQDEVLDAMFRLGQGIARLGFIDSISLRPAIGYTPPEGDSFNFETNTKLSHERYWSDAAIADGILSLHGVAHERRTPKRHLSDRAMTARDSRERLNHILFRQTPSR